jgi:hypothetical protein
VRPAWTPHALLRPLQERSRGEGHGAGLLEVDAQRVRDGDGEERIRAGGAEVGEDEAVLVAQVPAAQQRGRGSDACRPHAEVAARAQGEEQERDDAPAERSPPREQPRCTSVPRRAAACGSVPRCLVVTRSPAPDRVVVAEPRAVEPLNARQQCRVPRRGGAGRRRAFLHERGRQHDGQADDEEHDGEGRHPLRQAEAVREGEDHLVAEPGAYEVDAEHLPDGAAVHLDDDGPQLLHERACWSVVESMQSRLRDPGGGGRRPPGIRSATHRQGYQKTQRSATRALLAARHQESSRPGTGKRAGQRTRWHGGQPNRWHAASAPVPTVRRLHGTAGRCTIGFATGGDISPHSRKAAHGSTRSRIRPGRGVPRDR